MKLILIRAALTEAEWREIRKLAIDRNTTTAELAAQGLRDGLALKGGKR